MAQAYNQTQSSLTKLSLSKSLTNPVHCDAFQKSFLSLWYALQKRNACGKRIQKQVVATRRLIGNFFLAHRKTSIASHCQCPVSDKVKQSSLVTKNVQLADCHFRCFEKTTTKNNFEYKFGHKRSS